MHTPREKITQRRQHQARRTREVAPTTDHDADERRLEGHTARPSWGIILNAVQQQWLLPIHPCQQGRTVEDTGR